RDSCAGPLSGRDLFSRCIARLAGIGSPVQGNNGRWPCRNIRLPHEWRPPTASPRSVPCVVIPAREPEERQNSWVCAARAPDFGFARPRARATLDGAQAVDDLAGTLAKRMSHMLIAHWTRRLG